MNNLLLKENQKILKGEYVSRFWLVAVLIFIFIAVILAGIFSAAYIQVSIAKEIAGNQISKVESDKIFEQRKLLEEKNNFLIGQIRYLDKEIVLPSVFVSTILAAEKDGISISGLEINTAFVDPSDKKSKELIKIDLRGIAENRADLLAFQESLNQTQLFSIVDIPYSNFAKNSDIQFTAGLISSLEILNNQITKTQNE